MRSLVLAAVLCVACSTKPVVAPVHNISDSRDALLVVRARHALRDLPADFARPFSGMYDSSRVQRLFVDACGLGDRSSCLIAVSISKDPDSTPVDAKIRSNCLSGDMMSCRGIMMRRDGNPTMDGAPGEVGRSAGCVQRKYEPKSPCDARVLRRECTVGGFAWSCWQLVYIFSPDDWKALLARAAELGEVGCRAGIYLECQTILRTHVGGKPLQTAIEQVCHLLRNCWDVARGLDRAGHREAAARMHERTCQYSDRPIPDCLELGNAYLDHSIPEPIPGRGQALVDWACKQDPSALRHDICSHASARRGSP
jgi:hypothetical protein